MAQKVHPIALRLNQTNAWGSKWFSSKNFIAYLREDVSIREFLKKELKEASVNEVIMERTANGVTIVIRSAKPGVIIGRSGAGVEDLKKKVMNEFFRGRRVQLSINIEEVSNPSLFATLVGQQVIADIEKRMPYRRAMKSVIERSMKAGALGIKVRVSGRLNGAEIARRETLVQGKIPLHGLRANIDYASDFAHTIFGAVGVKVWIYKGDVFRDKKDNEKEQQGTKV
ncbi:MAG: 30S ribosomal protein S3 [bacterium]